MIQDRWIPFQQVEWDNPQFNKFNIDTRDFHVIANESIPHPDTDYLHRKYGSSFFHTIDELKTLIGRYYNESGGEQDWRYFAIQKSDNWHLKYIRVFRTDYGFIVCDKDNKAMRKDILSKSYLKQI